MAKGSDVGIGCAAIIGVLILISIFGSLGQKGTPPDNLDAMLVCQEFVKQRLKAPATAKFSDSSETAISGTSTGPWTVSGYLDAQNSFGALIRSRFSCALSFHTGEPKPWQLDDINIE